MPFSRRSDDDFHPQSQSGFRQQIGDFLDFWDSDEFRMSPMVSPPMELSGGMDNDRGSESAMETTTTRLATIAVSDRRLVRFSEDVSIICIPRRCDYPKDLRNLLFSNKKELSKNVARNLKEFASDGFDWRNVKEDHEMYITADGERIHPIHLAEILSKKSPPLPSANNLPKPKPWRPVHPSMRSSHNLKTSRGDIQLDEDLDPVIRPPTPFPYLMDGLLG